MLTDRRALLDIEVDKLKQKCAESYKKIVIQGLVELTDEYDEMKAKLDVITAERDQIKTMVESGEFR